MTAGAPIPPPAPPRAIKGRDVFLTIGFAVLLFFAGSLVAMQVVRPDAMLGPHRQFVVLLQLALMAFAMLGAVYLVPIRRSGLSWRDLGYVACDPRWIKRALLMAFVLVPALLAFGYFFRQVMPKTGTPDIVAMIAPAGFSWIVAATIILYAGFLTPIAEEIFFRGLIYGWLRRHMGATGAAVLAAAGFAILHQRIEAVIAAFFTGLILTWFYEKSGSLLPSIALHQAINATQLVLVYLSVGMAPAPAA
ncbi:MAG: type II CAAX endopeptidase family protein [Bauldia litoralis]